MLPVLYLYTFKIYYQIISQYALYASHFPNYLEIVAVVLLLKGTNRQKDAYTEFIHLLKIYLRLIVTLL